MELNAIYYSLLHKAEEAKTSSELDEIAKQLKEYTNLFSRLCVEIIMMTIEDRREAIA